MALIVENLKKAVIDSAKQSDEIKIISGYLSPDVIMDIANLGIPFTFYFGMYPVEGIAASILNQLKIMDGSLPNLTVNIVNQYRVHTKCYVFYNEGLPIKALVGSANCSTNGLAGSKNSEMLVELDGTVLRNTKYLIDLEFYAREIDAASVHCDDPLIFAKSISSLKRPRTIKGSNVPDSGDPLVAYMPLYTYKNGKKVVQQAAGINWGNQAGHTTVSGPMEAYIPIFAEHLDKHPLLFPPFPLKRSTTGGKSTRRSDPITVIWDDGTTMTMTFQGTLREYPNKKKRPVGTDPIASYPKQLTSGTDTKKEGGAKLGKYLRERMNLPLDKVVTMSDFKKYHRDYVILKYLGPGLYEADFMGTPLL